MIKCQLSKFLTKNIQNKNHHWDLLYFDSSKGCSTAVVNVNAASN